MATSYTTAIGRLRTDVNTLLAGGGSTAWKVTPYLVGTPTGSSGSYTITPTGLFDAANINEMYYFFDDPTTPQLTETTTVVVDYAARPTNSIVIFNGTLQNLSVAVTISGAFAAENSGANLTIRNPSTNNTETILPGESVSFYITADKQLIYFPGTVQLASSTAINTQETPA